MPALFAATMIWRPFFNSTRLVEDAKSASGARIPDIFLGNLTTPSNLARLHVEGHDGIRRLGCRNGVIVTGADIQQISFQVEGWSIPNRGSGRTPELGANRILLGLVRFFRNRVRLPQHVAVRGIQSDETSPEPATRVFQIAHLGLFTRGNRHV